MTTVDEFLDAPMRSDDECPIVKGRYLMKPPGASKLVSVQRMTNFIKAIEDTYNINRWDCRNVALGVANNDDLRDMIIATRADDKDALNDLCDKAKELAGGNKKSRQGTARHGITERIDLGEMTIDDVPPSLRPDIAAYQATLETAGIEILGIEKYVLHPDLLVGGRFDRVVGFGSQPKILDIKTGSLDFSAVAIAGQLYGYASAPYTYDPKTETCTPMPELDQEHALVAHVPTGEGRCTLYWVDLTVGKEAFDLATQVRALRRRRDVLDPWTPATRLDSVIERRVGIQSRIDTLRTIPGALDRLSLAWPPGIPTLKQSPSHTPEQLSSIDTVLLTIESQFSASFGPLDANHSLPGKGDS